MPKFEFDITVPRCSTIETEVVVLCGKSKIVLLRVSEEDFRGDSIRRLVGGKPGDWIPVHDWRERYVDKAENRADFALPKDRMISLAMAEVKDRETHRLLREAHDKMVRGL